MIHIEEQTYEIIDKSQLIEKVTQKKKDGCRLVQISCTPLENNLEITYTFDKDYKCSHLRLSILQEDACLPSISGVYLAAFAYENELHDLFGIKVTDLAIDFKGNFYKLSVKAPFSPKTQNKVEQ